MFAAPQLPGNDASTAAMQSSLNNAAQGYQNAYNHEGWMSRHPILTGIAATALLGPGGVAMPIRAKMDEAQRKGDVFAAWQEFQKNALANQESMDKMQSGRNARDLGNQFIQRGIDSGTVAANTPNLDPNKYYRPEDVQFFTKTAYNPSNLNFGIQALNNQQQQSFSMPSQLPPMATGEIKQPTNKPLPPVGNPGDTQPIQMDDGTGGALQAGVSRTFNDATPPYDINSLPLFMSDEMTKSIFDKVSDVATNGLTQGQDRYQFDQEAPKRAAEIEKLQAEVTQALASGDANKALAAYRRMRTAMEPGLIKSQIAHNMRPPAGRAPNALEMMTPEQRAQYLQRLAAGKGDTYSPSDAMGEAKLEFYANDPSVPAAMRQAAGSALTRLRGGKPSAPAAAPRGGGTMTTLSSGRKVKL